ncbi:MAG: hypothetical protein FWC92_07095 [Defluviitaleaceae bacterium]|nr:hypothetical protein [Defluviitaleaceae bacterium]
MLFSDFTNTKSKLLTTIGKVLTWIIAIGGIILGFVGLSTDEISSRILFFILLLSFIFVGLCSALTTVYTIYITRRYKEIDDRRLTELNQTHKTNNELHAQLGDNIKDRDTYIRNVSQFTKNISKTLNIQQVSLYILAERYIEEIRVSMKRLAENTANNIVPDEHYQEQYKKNAVERRAVFERSIFRIHNLFLGRMITETKTIIEHQLAYKGFELRVSITLKLLNRPIRNDDFRDSNVFAFTAFRDQKTYEDGIREIAGKEYSVQKNSAFSQCLTSDAFVKNNLVRGMKDYNNQHYEFDRFYDCTAVVPVALGSDTGQDKNLYGFLACDVLNNKTYDSNDIIDESTSNMLFAVASHIGILLNYAINAWHTTLTGEELNTSYLEYVYNMLKRNRIS